MPAKQKTVARLNPPQPRSKRHHTPQSTTHLIHQPPTLKRAISSPVSQSHILKTLLPQINKFLLIHICKLPFTVMYLSPVTPTIWTPRAIPLSTVFPLFIFHHGKKHRFLNPFCTLTPFILTRTPYAYCQFVFKQPVGCYFFACL